MDELVKQDISFLEYPLWMQDEYAGRGLSWKTLNGFIYETASKPPVKTDIVFLYYFLLQSQENGWVQELELTQYKCLRDCGIQPGKYWRDRLKESLNRWMHVVVTFEGTLYDGKKHVEQVIQFHIIDDWSLNKETQKLQIRLSPKWIEHIRDSNYYKMLNFEQFKSLRSPLATRLYEILIKSFQGRPTWSCGAKKLATKIPMKEQYPADIIPKIKTAVTRINEKRELQIKLEIRRPKRGKATFVFTKLSSAKSSHRAKEELAPQILDVSEETQEGLKGLYELVPSEHRHQKTIREAISRFLRKKGEAYARRNILYANKNAKSSYRAFLNKALKEDWGAGVEEDQQEAKKRRRERDAQARAKREKEDLEAQIRLQAHERLESLSPEEIKALEEEAKKGTPANVLKGERVPTYLRLRMGALLEKKIRAEKGLEEE